jgi:hypothetical protein
MDGDTKPPQPKRRNRTGRLSQLDPGLGSPLEAALAQRDGGTLAMVERALERGDTKLAFQPAIRADGKGPAFYEGLIRVLDDTGRIIPARDFMANVEERDLGRRIDCAALVTGLRTLKENPGLHLAINMSARSIGYPKWMGHPAQVQPQPPRRGRASDSRDHGKLGNADARDRHRLHVRPAREGRDLRARRFRRRATPRSGI